MRIPGRSLRRPIRQGSDGAVAAVGTILLVVITVVLVVVVGFFIFTVVRIPDEPPELKVNYVQLNNRWTISITSASDSVDLREMRILVQRPGGEFATYDNDGDGVANAAMVADLDDVTVDSADGPQHAPLVFIDSDANERITVGDAFVAFDLYFFPAAPLLDADRGFKVVGTTPNGIPRGSQLQILASPVTLGSSDINPGDTVQVDLKKGATLHGTTSGPASTSGTFLDLVDVPLAWPTGDYDAVFTIRPGEGDEWSFVYSFRVIGEDPLTAEERAEFEEVVHPFLVGDQVSLIHKPSNSVVLRFEL
jgi:hypothetical protein